MLNIISQLIKFESPVTGLQVRGWHHMSGWGGGFFMWIVVVILVAAIIYLVLRQRDITSGSGKEQDALEILKKRYARGELTKQEYDRMRKDLLE